MDPIGIGPLNVFICKELAYYIEFAHNTLGVWLSACPFISDRVGILCRHLGHVKIPEKISSDLRLNTVSIKAYQKAYHPTSASSTLVSDTLIETSYKKI